MAKLNVDLGEDKEETETAKKVKELAAPLPSISKAKSSAMKDAPRVQFAFSNVPKPIKDAFAKKATKLGLSQKDYLYECLRAGGLDIPDNEMIDGRRR